MLIELSFSWRVHFCRDRYIRGCMMSLSVLVMLGLQVSFATTYDSNVLSLSGRIFVAVTFVRFFNLHPPALRVGDFDLIFDL